MKTSTYTLSQRCVAYILLVSFFLQSCGNFSNTLVTEEFIAKESTDNIQESTKPIDIKPLVDQELNAEGGYLVTFHEEKGNLVADIRVDKTQKEPNYRNLPVEIEKGTDLAALPHLNKEIQQRRIQLGRAQNTKPSRILVFKRGLTGGMKKESDESDSEEVEKEDDNLLENEDPNDELSSLLEAKLVSNKENIEKDSKNEIIKPEKGPIPGSVIKLPTSTQPTKAVSGIKLGLTGESKSGKGFKPEINSAVEKALASILSLGYKVGTACDDGDCFFDTLAQLLDTNNNNALDKIKYLRGLCYTYYCKNKDIVNTWIQQDNLISPNLKYDYENIKNSAKEVEVPIWGKPVVEGRILCNHGILTSILVIEILQDPETKKLSVVTFYTVGKDGYKSLTQPEANKMLCETTIPTLINVQDELHFVPLLKISGTPQEEQKNKENTKESHPKAKKKQAKRETQKGGNDSRHQQNLDNEKELQNARRLQEDLKNLSRIESLTTTLINNSDSGSKADEKLVLDSLKEIGQLIHDISWKEDNPACIRNRHGYRNRYVKASNVRNDKGARLDFETLGYLKDLADDSDFNKLLTVNPSIVISSLKVLKAKVDYILANAEPKNPLEDSEKQEVGFLNTVSAFYHDKVCLERLINLISQINSEEFKQLDLSNKLHRYYLGYYFCHIGETAKQISDYIKPEGHQDATLNLTRFLFGKLGYYRQAIKNNPSLVYREQRTELLQMKLLLEKANSIGLSSFLQAIKNQMIESFIVRVNATSDIDYEKTVTAIDRNYPTVNRLIKTKSASDISIFSKFEQSCLPKIKELTVTLDNGTEEDLSQKITRSKTYKQGLIGKIRELETELTQPLAPETKELSTQQVTADPASEHVARLINQVLNASVAREIKSLIGFSPADIGQQLSKKLTPTQLGTIQLIDQFVVPAEQAKKPDAKTDLVTVISQKLKKYEKDLDKAIEQFRKKGEGANQPNNKEYTEIKSLIERNKADKPTLLKELFASLNKMGPSQIKKDRATLERQIKAAKLEVEDLEYKISLTETHVKEFLPSILSTKKEATPGSTVETSLSGKKFSTTYNTLKKIKHEIEFFRELEVSTDPKIDYASRMSIGFVGQYCKEIFTDTNPTISAELKQYTNHLLEECIARTIHIRHKLVMHNSTGEGHAEIKKTFTEFLTPSIKDFEALITVTNFDENSQSLIELSTAFARLGKYDKALAILQECLDKVENLGSLKDTNLQDYQGKDEKVDKLFDFMKKSKTLFNVSSEYVQKIQKKAEYYHDKYVILSLMLQCYLCNQDFTNALKAADTAIDHAGYIEKQFRLWDRYGTALGAPELPGKSEIISGLLTLKLHKSYILNALGQPNESYKILKNIEEDFENGTFNKNEQSSILARIYTDFIQYTGRQEYIEQVKKLVDTCSEELVVTFNILFREYEATNDFKTRQASVKKLNNYFEKNIAKFKSKHGNDYYQYLMEVRLAELNVTTDKSLRKKLFKELDSLYTKTNDIVLKNKLLISKLWEAGNKKDCEKIQEVSSEFCVNNINAGTSHKIYEYLFKKIAMTFFESGQFKHAKLVLEKINEHCSGQFVFEQETSIRHRLSLCSVKLGTRTEPVSLSSTLSTNNPKAAEKISQVKNTTSVGKDAIKFYVTGISQGDIESFFKGLSINPKYVKETQKKVWIQLSLEDYKTLQSKVKEILTSK